MTSTSFNVGLSDDARLSSRVLRPPGGGHTNIFGGEPDPPRTGRRCAPEANDLVANPAPEKPAEAPKQNGDGNTEAPAPESAQEEPANNNEAEKPKGNPDSPRTEPAKTEPLKLVVDPPKRVRVPPGGFSSGLW